MHKTFSKGDLNAIFRHLGRNIFFIQIGAMDGKTFDPIYPFVKKQNWRGILVEPLPAMYAKLKDNYAGCSGLQFVNKAISDYDGSIEMVRIDPADIGRGIFSIGAIGISSFAYLANHNAFGSHYHRLSKTSREDLQRHKKHLTVPCCSVRNLLAQHCVTKLDVLVIDAEGADWTIVRQFPLRRLRPRIVYFEYDHLTLPERRASIRHMEANGYVVHLDRVRQENLLALRQ